MASLRRLNPRVLLPGKPEPNQICPQLQPLMPELNQPAQMPPWQIQMALRPLPTPHSQTPRPA